MCTMCVRASTTYSDMLVFCSCTWHTLRCVMLIHQVPVFGQLMTGMVTLVEASATVLQANCTVSQLEANVGGWVRRGQRRADNWGCKGKAAWAQVCVYHNQGSLTGYKITGK